MIRETRAGTSARWDAERRTGDEDEVGTTFHATVNAHTVTREGWSSWGARTRSSGDGARCDKTRRRASARDASRKGDAVVRGHALARVRCVSGVTR